MSQQRFIADGSPDGFFKSLNLNLKSQNHIEASFWVEYSMLITILIVIKINCKRNFRFKIHFDGTFRIE